MHRSNHPYSFRQTHHQSGVVVIIFLFLVVLTATAYLMHAYSPAQLKNNQNKVTQQALADAKQALLAYAVEDITIAKRSPPLLRCVDVNSDGAINSDDLPYTPKGCNCGENCRRPGDLPCADKENSGEAKTACLDEGLRFGRFPWKTLGADDLRDGTGERLWYAVSNQYKNNPRLPMNSQTPGAISLSGIEGKLINDASINNGLVALVIAVQAPLTRYDLDASAQTQQIRSVSNINDPIQYLDLTQNEDNANFVEFSKNGFISGIKKLMQNNQSVIISNDVILPIYQSDIANISKTIVLNEVAKALKNDADILPAPSKANESTCKGFAKIEEGACSADMASTDGYIPVSSGDDATFTGWQTKNVNSILRGESMHNWFQQNGWRSLVKYQKNAPCQALEKWCRDIDSQMTIRVD
ncbi:MAG: hypothetical protein V4605_03570 [Pseudomonadota bacterium]